MYAMKYDRTMCQLGRKYVYKQSCGEKGVTTTLVCCTYAHTPQEWASHPWLSSGRKSEWLRFPCLRWFVCHQMVGWTPLSLQSGFTITLNTFPLAVLQFS